MVFIGCLLFFPRRVKKIQIGLGLVSEPFSIISCMPLSCEIGGGLLFQDPDWDGEAAGRPKGGRFCKTNSFCFKQMWFFFLSHERNQAPCWYFPYSKHRVTERKQAMKNHQGSKLFPSASPVNRVDMKREAPVRKSSGDSELFGCREVRLLRTLFWSQD